MAPMASNLDQFQQCVVAFPPERSLVVSACAGSGKSSTLALRAKALVDGGIRAERARAHLHTHALQHVGAARTLS